tara:strand:+ start:2082 stop:2735 length:654 start_codon:yes stop_codon:yes gene_type:complete
MSKILKIEDISTDRLRKMLGGVKRALNTKMGSISKMKKPELLNKITELQYKWNVDKQQLTTNSMIRKKSVVELPPMKIRVRTVKPLTKEKKVELLKKMVSDFDTKKSTNKFNDIIGIGRVGEFELNKTKNFIKKFENGDDINKYKNKYEDFDKHLIKFRKDVNKYNNKVDISNPALTDRITEIRNLYNRSERLKLKMKKELDKLLGRNQEKLFTKKK